MGTRVLAVTLLVSTFAGLPVSSARPDATAQERLAPDALRLGEAPSVGASLHALGVHTRCVHPRALAIDQREGSPHATTDERQRDAAGGEERTAQRRAQSRREPARRQRDSKRSSSHSDTSALTTGPPANASTPNSAAISR